MPSIERIAVIGAGALGAVYATKFFDMDQNCVSLIAKGERYLRLREEGVAVNNRHYFLPLLRPEEDTLPSDLVIVAVKHHHLPEALHHMKNVIGEKSVILSVMNGIESEEQIGAVYGMEKVLYAVSVGIDAVRRGNKVTYSKQGKLFFGEADNALLTERVRAVQVLFDKAGIVYETPPDMIRVLWWKFMINVGINQVSAVLRAPYRVFQESQDARDLMEAAMKEVIAIAQVRKIHLSEEDIKRYYLFLSAMSPDGKTSMVQDIEAKRKTEIEMFAGKVNQLGRKHAVPTPVNQALFSLIKVMETYPY